jgi:predicted MPP superfamily phosphohydrolase
VKPSRHDAGLDELAELVGSTRPAADSRKPFALRRFAGPLPYVEQMDPLRVAHVTDLHVGRVTPMEVQRQAVDLVNAGDPDLVVITGDFVCHSQLYLDALTELVETFDAPVIAVLGNHDHWSGPDEVRRALARGGVEVLDNAHTVITLRHQRVQVLGIDDAYTGHADIEKAAHGLRSDLPVLGLSHIAEEADGLWAEGVPLVLSGHTHGGQVTLAGLHELMVGRVVGHRYVHGLYGSRSNHDPAPAGAVYVGAGVGAAVVPLRLGERGKREVTFFELGVHPGSFVEPHHEQSALPGRKPTARTREKRALAVEKKRLRRERRGGMTRR